MARMRLDDMPMIYKIGLAPALALALLAAVSVGSAYVTGKTTSTLDHVVKQELPEALQLADISERITAAHGELYMLLTRQSAAIETDKITARAEALQAEVKSIRAAVDKAATTAPASQRASLKALSKDVSAYDDAVSLVITMLGTDVNTAAQFTVPFEEQYVQMTATLGKVVDASSGYTVRASETAVSDAKALSNLSLGIAALSLLAVGALSAVLVLATRRGVMNIAKATEKLAGGDNEVNLDGLKRRDELGAIVTSLQVFRDNQVHLAKLNAEQKAIDGRTAAERLEQERIRAEHAKEQEHAVHSVAKGLEHLTQGDMTYRIDETFAPQYEKLRTDFNAAMDEMETILSNIVTDSDSMQTGAQEITVAADDLSRRTEQQAASLEETAAAIDQITATVRKSSEGASLARDTVGKARGEAEQSGDVVRKAVSAMNEIEKSSSQIGNIIGVIDEIAFQTNLLALNAGVEAARAGEAGRGFAVVAQEVRALAQRSAEAAKEIKALISTSSQQVGAGAQLVNQTGEALTHIVARVGEINSLVAEIAASSQEQATGLQQVNNAINQMDQITQQNAAMVEQSTAASHSLSQQAKQLNERTARFQVRQGRSSAAVRSAPRPAARPAPKAAARPAFQGAAALKMDAPSKDGWEEF